MKLLSSKLQDAKLIEAKVFGDHRGFFTESYSQKDYRQLGIEVDFVQDNYSYSLEAGVLRGLHFQTGDFSQSKLIRVVSGAVWDVIVDLRKGSPTYGQWEGFILSQANHRQLFVPKGFAHGFLTLTDRVHFMYKCDQYYAPEADGGLIFSDPDLNIPWPMASERFILSDKDKGLPTLKEFEKVNAFVYGEV